jgi:hypothetical protein
MMNQIYSLKIENPCHQDWSSMSKVDQGKYCSHCSKTVIDFSKFSDAEIIRYLDKNKGTVCGRLKNNQIERKLKFNVKDDNPFLHKVFTSLILSFSINNLYATNLPSTEQNLIAIDTFKIDSEIQENKTDKQIQIIRGNVADANSKEILIQASVYINDKLNTVTDLNGDFNLNIPSDFNLDSIQLKISYVGYFPLDTSIHRLDFNKAIQFSLIRSINMDEVTITGLICVAKKPKWWQFWKKGRWD